MGSFLLRRTGVMLLTALCLTFIVFFLTNLEPNLEKLTKSEGNMRMSDSQVQSWLQKNGYRQPLLKRYGEWLGVAPGWTRTDDDGKVTGRCIKRFVTAEEAPKYCGILQGDWGFSLVFKEPVFDIIKEKLGHTGKLMLCVLIVMVPAALVIGVIAGMREGSKTDRILSTFSILTTSTPEYVSGVIFIIVFASRFGGLGWFKSTAATAMEGITFENFTLPVMALALYGLGYIARMTRASMALLLACSVVAVFVVLMTQLISDIGYVFLNPRVRVS